MFLDGPILSGYYSFLLFYSLNANWIEKEHFWKIKFKCKFKLHLNLHLNLYFQWFWHLYRCKFCLTKLSPASLLPFFPYKFVEL